MLQISRFRSKTAGSFARAFFPRFGAQIPARRAQIPARRAQIPARGAQIPARRAQIPARVFTGPNSRTWFLPMEVGTFSGSFWAKNPDFGPKTPILAKKLDFGPENQTFGPKTRFWALGADFGCSSPILLEIHLQRWFTPKCAEKG